MQFSRPNVFDRFVGQLAAGALGAVGALGAFVATAPVGAQANPQDPTPAVGNRVLVRWKAGTPQATRVQQRQLRNATLDATFALVPGLEQWTVADPAAVVQALQADPAIAYAERDQLVELAYQPNDPRFPVLWGIQRIGCEAAWDQTVGGDVVIAVIDTGVDYLHQDLAANMWINPDEIAGNGIDDDGNGYVDDVFGANIRAGTGDPMDDNGHGTHVAGTAGARGDNGIGVVGVNQVCRIMALKIFPASGTGALLSDACVAIDYAVAHGARVSNHSWGGAGYSQALQNCIAAAGLQGHLVVAAAGNNGTNNDGAPLYPAAYDLDNIIAVAASDLGDGLVAQPAWSWGSNYGVVSVDLVAPGVQILSTVPGNAYQSWAGTSMATPHVAGAAALLWSAFPHMSWQDVRAEILDTRTTPLLSGLVATAGILDLTWLGDTERFHMVPEAIEPLAVNQSPDHAAVGDVDGDGRDDVLFHWAQSGTNRLAISDGNGGFTVVTDPIPVAAVNQGPDRVVAGDVNSDGFADFLFVWTSSGANRLAIGDGAGGFSVSVNPISPVSIQWLGEVVALDFDGDARCDFLFVDPNTGANRLLRSLGGGSFSNLSTVLSPLAINGAGSNLVAGDFDADGHDDLLVHWPASGQNRFFLSNGLGSFATWTDPIPPAAINGSSGRVLVGDADGDGTSDLLFLLDAAGTNRLYRSRGDGQFDELLDPLHRRAVNGAPDRALAADTDGDGLADYLLHWGASGQSRMFVAKVVPGTAAEFGVGCGGYQGRIPAIDSVGRPARSGTIAITVASARPLTAAALLVGTELAPTPLPSGCTFYPSLAGAILVVPTDGSGRAQQPLALPNLPTLAGLAVYAQWAVLDPDGPAVPFLGLPFACSRGLEFVIE